MAPLLFTKKHAFFATWTGVHYMFFSMWKRKFRSLLKETLDGNVDGAGKRTLRSLAKDIGMSPGAVSAIINGKRRFSERAALQILSALPLDPERKKEFEDQFHNETSGNRVLLRNEFEVLISKWFYLAILCLFELEESPQTHEEIAKRLGLSEEEARQAVDSLLQMGLLRKTKDHRLEYMGPYWTTTDEVSSQTVRRAHFNELNLAARALAEVPVGDRDFTNITFSGNSQQLKRVKKEIRKFRDRVNQIMEEGDSDRVYKFNIQIFPVDGLGGDL